VTIEAFCWGRATVVVLKERENRLGRAGPEEFGLVRGRVFGG